MWQIGFYSPNAPTNIKTAVVLGAAVHNGAPSPVFRERINHAISLYKNKQIDKIIFTGGIGVGDKLAESEVGKLYASYKGVNANDILIETRSRNTHQNLLEACKIMRANKIKSVIIISDPLHLKRSVNIARDSGMDAYSSATPTTRYRSFKAKSRFLFYETYYYVGHMLRKTFSAIPKCSP